jgi:hypothetical protein
VYFADKLNILSHMASTLKDQVMKTEQTALPDIFSKVSDSYAVTNCHNGFVVDVSGEDRNGQYVNINYVLLTSDELRDTVQDLAYMPKS